MGTSLRLVDHIHPVMGFPTAVPSTAVPQYVGLENYNHLTIVIEAINATTVTGCAVTVNQAIDVGGDSAKALAIATVWVNADVTVNDTLVATPVVSNTFTMQAVNSKHSIYIIEIDAPELDQANAFDYVQVGLANATAQTVSVMYYLSGARVGGGVLNFPSAIL